MFTIAKTTTSVICVGNKVGDKDKSPAKSIICLSLRCLKVRKSWEYTTAKITMFVTRQSVSCWCSKMRWPYQSTTWSHTRWRRKPSSNLDFKVTLTKRRRREHEFTSKSREIFRGKMMRSKKRSNKRFNKFSDKFSKKRISQPWIKP